MLPGRPAQRRAHVHQARQQRQGAAQEKGPGHHKRREGGRGGGLRARPDSRRQVEGQGRGRQGRRRRRGQGRRRGEEGRGAGAGAGASSFFAPAAALAAPSTATLAAAALAFHLSTRIRTGAKTATTAAFAAFMVSRTFFLSSALSLLASLMDVRSPLSRPPREHLSGRKKEQGYRQYTENQRGGARQQRAGRPTAAVASPSFSSAGVLVKYGKQQHQHSRRSPRRNWSSGAPGFRPGRISPAPKSRATGRFSRSPGRRHAALAFASPLQTGASVTGLPSLSSPIVTGLPSSSRRCTENAALGASMDAYRLSTSLRAASAASIFAVPGASIENLGRPATPMVPRTPAPARSPAT
mmetsp:Transcript_6832/g.21383  ORF Transcript_6832/g.21383 Transcript_6832/m.21383 type:complete len:354 (+) Transcript_6832:709-1770(+)